MASNAKAVPQQKEGEVLKRIEWMDEQRRKSARKLVELEQRFSLLERTLVGREDRIQELERQLSNTTAQLARISEIDVQLAKFRDEMVELIEQYDKRRVQGEKEMDRLRRIEHETMVREITDIRQDLPAISRLENEMELRHAEDNRLANLIGNLQNSVSPLRNQVADWEQALTFLEEKEKQNSQSLGETQTQLLEINKKWNPLDNRIEILANTLSKAETSRQDLIDAQVEQREIIKKWSEQIQIGEHERNKQLEKWRYVMEEQKDALGKYSREWVSYSDQYQEAKMALHTLAEWQKQMESQQRESSELLRMELNRMQSRWDGFVLKDEQKWRGSDAEMEQRWIAAGRSEKQVQDQILELSSALTKFQEDKDLLWRIQTAQADAIKLIPHVWLEEIDKAIAQNPNRRRQPTMVQVREE